MHKNDKLIRYRSPALKATTLFFFVAVLMPFLVNCTGVHNSSTVTVSQLGLSREEQMVHDAAWASIENRKNEGDNKYTAITGVNVERIRKLEWEELFPDIQFYITTNVAEEDAWYDCGETIRECPANPYRQTLYAVYEGKVYGGSESVERHFNEWLVAHRIKVTDTNRELVAKAFIQVGVGAPWITGEVTFSNPRTINERGFRPHDRYTYYIENWLQIRGLVIAWRLQFYPNGQVDVAEATVLAGGVGNYIPVSDEFLLWAINIIWSIPATEIP